MGWQKQAKDWDEYRRLYRRWRMGFEHFQPIKPSRGERGRRQAAPPVASPALEEMSYRELQELAKARGVSAGGTKAELVASLQEGSA